MEVEFVKALLNIIVAIITLSLGWLVGQRLTIYWAIRQKRKELELLAVAEFYKLYGEFFAVWKLWAYHVAPPDELTFPDSTRWSLLERACAAEGALESIFVKLSSERVLSESYIEILGRFRQAYQQLRESIRDNKDIEWWSHDQPEYLSFKRLAFLTACIILSEKHKDRTGEALIQITANTWENRWLLDDKDWSHLKALSS
jgi:hypothetical protein